VRLGIAGLSAVAFAASFGFNFGVGNQVTYLIPALRLLDPGLFGRDWFATGTTQYHPVFAELGAALLRLDQRGWAVALGLTSAVTAAALALYALCRTLVGRRRALAAYFTLLALLFATQTRGPALTYVFNRELQPSTLSSACLLGAMLAFTAGRWFASSVLLAAGSLVHINFAILCAPAFAAAQLLLGREKLARRLVLGLTLPVLALLAFVPTLRAAALPSPDAELGRHVYLTIRAPHHFVLGPKLGEFLPLAAWHGVAIAALLPLVRAPGGLSFVRLGALAASISAVAWGGAFAALGSERAAALFTWRVAPHAELAFQVLSVTAGVRALLDPDLARRYRGKAGAGVAVALGLLFVVYALRRDGLPAEVVGAAIAAALVWRAFMRWAGAGTAPAWLGAVAPARAPELLAVLTGLVLVNFAVGPLGRIPERSSLLRRARSTRALCTFMREHTPKQALFLTPPDDDSLRFFGERAIVVDWKGNPALPAEVLAWYRRIEDVTGRYGMTREDELRGYDQLDTRRLETLRERYGFDYAVVRRGREGALGAYPRAFEDAAYVVLKVGSAGG
jgi:hypothetical protein